MRSYTWDLLFRLAVDTHLLSSDIIKYYYFLPNFFKPNKGVDRKQADIATCVV